MAHTNLLIGSIDGYSSVERAMAISAELFAITRPPIVRTPEDVSTYRFDWRVHPTTNECVLIVDYSHVIKVHPLNNLTTLISLFPDLNSQEKANLAGYIQSNTQIVFGAIVPSDATILTEAEMTANGWFETE